MKRYKALTIVEILTVLVVMAILLGLLLPAVTKIMSIAKEAKQKSQFITLTIATEAFRNDNGYYPPSNNLVPGDPASNNGNSDYCGSQKLAEAFVGYDLFGFHPKSIFNSTGDWDGGGTDYDNDPSTGNLKERKGPYVEIEKANTVLLSDSGTDKGYFVSSSLSSNYILCDTFEKQNNNLGIKIGAPILYYRAYSNRVYHNGGTNDEQIYDYMDNKKMIDDAIANGVDHELDATQFYDVDYITNKNITAQDLPYNKDSFIFISAGKDGLYGTNDDIFNFDKD